MKAEKMRPPVLADLKGAKNEAWGVNNPTLAKSRRAVNIHALFFHLLPVNGLGLAGGWADRLVIWLPMVDMAARLLREVVEGRI